MNHSVSIQYIQLLWCLAFVYAFHNNLISKNKYPNIKPIQSHIFNSHVT